VESRTERLMRALGNREAFAVITALLEAETTQTALGRRTRIAAQTLERALETLSQAGLVDRMPGTQGAWFVTHWPETFALLTAARTLGIALAGTDDRAEADEAELFDRLRGAGAATPAATRGGRRRRPGSDPAAPDEADDL
jgi:DNA-binding MarR family transcriptional regulator